jgi:hypothetical protein
MWDECLNSNQIRLCRDKNNCTVPTSVLETNRTCTLATCSAGNSCKSGCDNGDGDCTCSEQSGSICASTSLCFGKAINSTNSTECCTGNCDNIKKDFNIIKYNSKEYSTGSQISSAYIPGTFSGVEKSLLLTYNATGISGNPIKVIIQAYDTTKSYTDLKNNLIIQFNNTNTNVTENTYNGKNYMCAVLDVESEKCLWVSDKKVIYTAIELSKSTIDGTTSLRSSWIELIQYFVNYYTPST